MRTTSIPIVFSTGGDPVRLGLVENLNRPSGNATGVYVFVSELGPKRLQLLREFVPRKTLIAFIVNLNSLVERKANAVVYSAKMVWRGGPELCALKRRAPTMAKSLLGAACGRWSAPNPFVKHKNIAPIHPAIDRQK